MSESRPGVSPAGETPAGDAASRALVGLHLRFGWSALLVFAVLGTTLEMLHAFKVGFYLDVPNETRRFLWTLGHAHGTLLSLLNVAFAATVHVRPLRPGPGRLASRCLIAANVLMPSGFLLGGLDVYGGDPGLGAPLLVPLGALLLVVGVASTIAGLRPTS